MSAPEHVEGADNHCGLPVDAIDMHLVHRLYPRARAS